MNVNMKLHLKFALLLLFGICSISLSDSASEKYTGYIDATLTVDGIERTYCMYVPDIPAVHNREPLPLLIALHGAGGTAKGMEENVTLGKFDELAYKEGFIVVYPDGVQKQWNDGKNDTNTSKDGVDDVEFISMLIDEVAKVYSIDDRRIYVTGLSNGGMMAFRLACELSDRITAIAAVAALMPENLASTIPTDKVSVLLIHGTDDPLVPWDGGNVHLFSISGGRVLSVAQTVEFWVNHNGCSLQIPKTYLPDVDETDETRVWKEEYTNVQDGARVVLYGIDGGGHSWPGGIVNLPMWIIGRTNNDINACDLIWTFFKSVKK
ncbi:MAG TPA: PHB depolymerase family esterase [Fervidobacterium sp.]|nr:PHB depolymerase family esterase [Fervidobacterium sp.]